ncbi:2-oxo-4-hydroxy-4-carboxy-5-ureidoimidazoline decarboxylase-like [Macrobrachium nipponense]|uniref:2-oxo-4-hydroxy-4-carboxy-5-ureidoimidazoline decarboxylase-like n=1 Tax=Macrobrachium nipponense TaxID=159736 RepID=UPI0030C85F4C
MEVKARHISEVNRMDYEEFIEVFGNVIEHCSLCAAAVWRYRPFRDVKHLHEEIGRFIDDLPEAGREAILRSHPDLAGRLAGLGKLTSESTREQKAAGLDGLTQEERTQMATMNNQYREQFGFPFVICARENKKEAILQGLATRLKNSPQAELAKGIIEVKKICYLRLLDLVEHEGVESRL